MWSFTSAVADFAENAVDFSLLLKPGRIATALDEAFALYRFAKLTGKNPDVVISAGCEDPIQ